jgi:hypothetical protein
VLCHLRNLVVQDGESASKKRSLAILNMTLDNIVIEEKEIRLKTVNTITLFIKDDNIPLIRNFTNSHEYW